MFTGIVQCHGVIENEAPEGGDIRITIDCGRSFLENVQLGDSIAVSGVCLTVVEKTAVTFSADVSAETLKSTTLGKKRRGNAVNLEKSLTLAQPLGGHLVTGHVDGIGTIVDRANDARSVRFSIELPIDIGRYVARKGSVCVDGVSLTVNETNGAVFTVNIVPHTLNVTTLQDLAVDDQVNIEVDIIARYVERLMTGQDTSGV